MPGAPPHFQTTRWTLISRLKKSADSAEKDRILQDLCQACWLPLYSYARRSGRSPEDAEDLTQSFFQFALASDLFSKANREKGRLRTFLLRAFQNHMSQWRAREGAAKRGADVTFSFDSFSAEERYQHEPKDLDNPETLYHRRWAREFFKEVTERLRHEMEQEGKSEAFVWLSPWIFTTGNAGQQTQAAEALGVTLENLRTILGRLRKRYRELFREAVRETLDAPTEDEINEEIRALIEFGTRN